jgi:sugar phosphate permease
LRSVSVFYGWRIVLAGAAIFMLQALLYLYGFGVFFNPLLKSLGTSRAALGGVLGLSRLGSGLLAPGVGWLIDRYGPRRLMLVGLTLVGIGFLAFSGITSLWMLYVVFFGMALGTSLGSFAPITVTVSNWFVRKRARALGLVSLGSALGGSLSWALAWLIDTLGWQRSAAIAGLCYLGIAVPLASVFRHRPEQVGLLPDGASPAPPVETSVTGGTGADQQAEKREDPGARAAVEELDFTPSQALMTRAFWMLAVSFVSFSMLITVIEVYQVPFFTEDVGLSFVTAAAVTSLFPLASVPGRIAFGWLGDAFNLRVLLAGLFFGQAVGLVVLSQAQSLAWAPVYLVILAPAFGGTIPIRNATVASYFGRRNLGTITGLFALVGLPGSALAPVFIGWVFDRMGSYRPGFLIIAVLMVVAGGALLLAVRPQPKVRGAVQPPAGA